MRHKKPRARLRNLLSFELVSDFLTPASCHRLTLSSQKHDKPTGRSSLNRKSYFLRILIWPNLRTRLKTPKCRILLQRISLKLKNVSEKKAGRQKRKSEDRTKRVSRSLLDVYCIYWKKIVLIRSLGQATSVFECSWTYQLYLIISLQRFRSSLIFFGHTMVRNLNTFLLP